MVSPCEEISSLESMEFCRDRRLLGTARKARLLPLSVSTGLDTLWGLWGLLSLPPSKDVSARNFGFVGFSEGAAHGAFAPSGTVVGLTPSSLGEMGELDTSF